MLHVGQVIEVSDTKDEITFRTVGADGKETGEPVTMAVHGVRDTVAAAIKRGVVEAVADDVPPPPPRGRGGRSGDVPPPPPPPPPPTR